MDFPFLVCLLCARIFLETLSVLSHLPLPPTPRGGAYNASVCKVKATPLEIKYLPRASQLERDSVRIPAMSSRPKPVAFPLPHCLHELGWAETRPPSAYNLLRLPLALRLNLWT